MVPQIERAKIPSAVYIPLVQAGGIRLTPCVQPGQTVCTGTLVAVAENEAGVFAHSSVTGVVREIAVFPHALYGEAPAIKIESQGEESLDLHIQKNSPFEWSYQQFTQIIRECGIVEMNGSGRPLHLRFSPHYDNYYHTLVINGVEAEPYVTADNALMVEKTVEIISGARALKQILQPYQITLAVGKDQMEILEVFNSKLFSLGEEVFKTRAVPLRYPQGNSGLLIEELFAAERAGKEEEFDAGVLVLDPATVLAVWEALRFNKPCYERVVTLTGECLAQPKNIWLRVGTTVEDALKSAKGLLRAPGQLILGNPLGGAALTQMQAPVVKEMKAIVALPPEHMRAGAAGDCIQCGRCVEACPAQINPALIGLAVEKERWDIAGSLWPEACVECGNCSYVCPSLRPMMDMVVSAKEKKWRK